MTKEEKTYYEESLKELCKDKDKYLYSLQKVLDELEEEYYGKTIAGVFHDKKIIDKIKHPKLSKDLKKLNIRMQKIDGERIFRYDENVINEDKTETYPVEFFNYVTANTIIMGANVRVLKVHVQSNCENIVCEKIYEHFGGANIIWIPAYKSVCVITSKK